MDQENILSIPITIPISSSISHPRRGLRGVLPLSRQDAGKEFQLSQQQNCKSAVERAFEIAGSGEVQTIERLGHVLRREGYALNVLTGPLLLKQLRARIAGARQSTASVQPQT